MTRDEIQKVRAALVAADNAILTVYGYNEALRILDRALAAPEQEPFCYVNVNAQGDVTRTIKRKDKWCKTPLYRHPAPQSAQPMQWIDVSERVPDEAQIVLFVLKGKVVVGAWIAGIFWYDNAKQVASAWMPLPPPPELGVGGYPITAPPAAKPEPEPEPYEILVLPAYVDDEPDAHRVKMKVGVQQFTIGMDYWETKAEAESYAVCFLNVLRKITAPPAARSWVGLTDEEINQCAGAQIYPSTWAMAFARAIEAALRAKNTGEQA